MIEHNSAFDRYIVHQDFHAGSVRVVPNDQVADETAAMKLLFPHESVISTPMRCHHTCLYTDQASPWLVAERIAEHLIEVEHVPQFDLPFAKTER